MEKDEDYTMAAAQSQILVSSFFFLYHLSLIIYFLSSRHVGWDCFVILLFYKPSAFVTTEAVSTSIWS